MTSSNIPLDADLTGKKVLIVRLSALGDVIRTIPAVVSLKKRFPAAEFHWLVEKPSSQLVEAVAGLHALPIDRAALRKGSFLKRWRAMGAVIRRIREMEFDVSIDFHGVLKSGIFPWLARLPVRVGYERGGSKEGHRWLINRRLTLDNPVISRYERNMALARFVGGDIGPKVPEFQLPAEDAAQVETHLAGRPILFFPGTSAHGRNKRWPAASWAWLYRQIAPRHPVRFMFGPADQPYREALMNLLGADFREIPTFKLPQLAAALKASGGLVACDTGPLHLAAVLNVPVVALLGPSDPVLNEPRALAREVILPGVACAPCRNRDCTLLICQDATTPRRVEAAVHRLLIQDQELVS